MLNGKNERELAYLVRIDKILPMDADRLECARVMGWNCVVGKGEFKAGDIGVYFEIDSKLPEVEPFASMDFLKSKHFKIKTQKIRGVVSQGLLMPVSAFGWELQVDDSVWVPEDGDHGRLTIYGESRFLTERLGVTYAVSEDNKRKSSGNNKYRSMADRHKKLFKRFPFKYLMRYEWGRKLLFKFFGKKKDGRNWPEWVVKTDEERCQNLLWSAYAGTGPWMATEKIDGTSSTYTLRKKGLNREYFVCSRNVVFDKPDKNCYYDTNVYLEISEKYHMEEVLNKLMNCDMFADCEWITLQGEIYGAGIQKRTYGLDTHEFAGFNLITSKHGRLNSASAADILKDYGISWVPIYDVVNELPDTIDEVLDWADGNSFIDGDMREGIVFRSMDGKQSFKAVSNRFLMKYHF